MSGGAWAMAVAMLLAGGSLGFVLFSIARSIQDHRSGERSLWREFGLGLALMVLFFATWVAHGILQWQRYTDQQQAAHQPTAVGDFAADFGQSTLENWQSEFLQLFAFVVLAALYIHKGSSESKDGEEKLEAALRRIEERLGTLPGDAPQEPALRWQLPDTPLRYQDLAAEGAPAGSDEEVR